MTKRYLDSGERVAPFDPLRLVEAFLSGAIPFDATSKLQQVLNQHLQNDLIARRPEFRDVAKLLAAFPTDGATRDAIDAAGLWEPTQELQRLAQGDIVVTVGGGRDNQGEEVPYGVTLRGLEPSSAVASDWLTQTIREFARSYVEQADKTIERAERAFGRLLVTLFREPGWKEVERVERRRTDGTAAAVLFRGGFASTAKRFPERRVLVRLVREGDTPPNGRDDVDFTLDVVLRRHLDVDDRARRGLAGAIATEAPNHARIELNLFHQESDQFYPDLQTTLQPVVSPYQVTPLLMLALHDYLDEKRRAHLIPKDADRDVEQVFQPSLLHHSAEEALNAALGAAFNARGDRVLEALVRSLCERRFPEYRTIIVQQHWNGALRDYTTALERLGSRYERQGEADVTDPKEAFAQRFNRTNTSFDSFVQTFPDLIQVVTPFRGREPGAVRFRLHPFETRIRELLRHSQKVETVTKAGQKQQVRTIDLKLARHAGRNLGYRDEEIDALLELMATRELVEIAAQRGIVREVAHATMKREDLIQAVTTALRRRTDLLELFPDEPGIGTQAKDLRQMQQAFEKNPAAIDEQMVVALSGHLRHFDRNLDAILDSALTSLRTAVRELAQVSSQDPHQRHRLHEEIGGTAFAPQLDAIRATLLKDAYAVKERRDALNGRAFDVLSHLGTESAADDVIRRGHHDLTEMRQAAKKIEADATALEDRCGNLTTARRALTQAASLDGRLRQGDVADPDLSRAVSALTQRIQAELSSRKLAVIANAAQWETDLMGLSTKLDQQLTARQQAFDERKGQYLELLRQYAHIPATSAPLATIYNPLDPAGSWRALPAEVSTLLLKSLDRVSAQLGGWTAAMHQLLASGELAYLDNAAANEHEATLLLADLASAGETAKRIAHEAADAETVADLDGASGRFLALMRCYADVTASVVRLAPRHQAIVSVAKTRQLSNDEQQLLAALETLAAANGATLEVGTLMHERGIRDPAGIEELWRLLQGLHGKRRVRIEIAPVQHG